MMKIKGIISGILAAAAAVTLMSCSGGKFSTQSDITVISRESGSGTRGAFVELFGVEQKDASGNKVDKTVTTSDIIQSTGAVLTSVSGNENAIGYVSLGALNDTVKALKIDGVTATAANVKNGTYKASRPFNIVTKGELSGAAADLISYILSSEGQAIVEQNGYIASVDGAAGYAGTQVSGKISISGSTSVNPVMEKLIEAYKLVNPNATLEINVSDSSTGISDASSGVTDIGMASRELKESELAQGVTATAIAKDGIAVIVNTANTTDSLTTEQVCGIYTGQYTKWADITG